MSLETIKEKYEPYLDKFFVFERKNQISVSLIVVKKEFRGQGIGRKIFNDLIEYSELIGKPIVLSPDSSFGTSKTSLINFYKSLGFVINKGKNKDFTISDLMYRKPKVTVEETIMYTKTRFQKLAGLLTEDHKLDTEKVNVKDDDDEALMAKSQLEQMASQANELLKLMPSDAHLEGWVQSKLTLANEMLDVVYHYLMDESSHKKQDQEEEEEKDEKEKED